MTEKILAVIEPICEQTGLDIDIFTFSGERIASTRADEPVRPSIPTEEMLLGVGGIEQQAKENLTLFAVKILSRNYVGAITGSNDISRNYAMLVSRLMESSLANLTQSLDKASEYRLLIDGGMTRLQTEQFKTKYSEVFPCFVLTFSHDAKREELIEYLKDLSQDGDAVVPMADGTVVVCKVCKDLDEYQSPSEFAHTLSDNMALESSLKPYIGVGDIAECAEDLRGRYDQAVTALRHGIMLDPGAYVYYHKDYFLINLFEELPKEKILRYLEEGIDEGFLEIFEDREMMDTAEQFLLGSLNISETARIMFMHRNTLIYRLDKIEKSTGLNIRRFADAMTFRALAMLFKLGRERR